MQKEYIKIINWIHAFDKKSTKEKVQMLQELPPAVINELTKWKPIQDSSDVLYNQEAAPVSPVSMKEASLEISKKRTRPQRLMMQEMSDVETSDAQSQTEKQSKKKKQPDTHKHVKHLLKAYAPLKKFGTLPSAPPGPSEVDTITAITLVIKQNLFEALKFESIGLQYRYQVALNLRKLAEEFKKLNKGKLGKGFFEHLEAHFNIKQRSFHYYQKLLVFLEKYKRFQYCCISYRLLTDNINLRKWFDSDECKKLPSENKTCSGFWQEIPTENHTGFVKDIHEGSSDDDSEDELSDNMSELSINTNALVKRIPQGKGGYQQWKANFRNTAL